MTIRRHVQEHRLVVQNSNDQTLVSLRQAGVIPFKTTVVNLLPRATIDELVRIINTDEAKAAYRQIIGEWREAKKARPSLPGQAGSSRTGLPYDRTRAAVLARVAQWQFVTIPPVSGTVSVVQVVVGCVAGC